MSHTFLLHQSTVHALGWSLLHFIWQGTGIAAGLALLLIVLRQAAAHVRYLVQCAALLLMAVCPVITSFWLITNAKPITSPAPGSGITRAAPPRGAISRSERAGEVAINSQSLPAAGPFSASAPKAGTMDEQSTSALVTEPAFVPGQIAASAPAEHAWQRWIEPSLPWMVTCWLLGVCGLSVRLLLGWRFIQCIKRLASAPAVEEWHQRCRHLAARLKISRSVRLLESALIEVPTVIGWLRPMILLPASAVAGLEPAQLEAILTHELAHIRRHDYLVNLIQTALETLLFYHPAVWWVSRQIRDEREHCCDDIAVELCGNRVTYVRALAEMEELRASPRLTLAMNSGSLLGRIRRLVYPSSSAPQSLWRSVSPASILILVSLIVAAYWSVIAKAEPQDAPLKFGVKLEDGVTVQLMGVSSPHDLMKWWEADGTPLNKSPAKSTNTVAYQRGISSQSEQRYLVWISGLSSSETAWIVDDDATGIATGSSIDENFRESFAESYPKAKRPTATLRVGIRRAEFGPPLKFDLNGNRLLSPAIPDDLRPWYDLIAISKITEADGKTEVALPQFDLRRQRAYPQWRAVDIDEKEIAADEQSNAKVKFAVPRSRLNRIEVRLQPYKQWVTFENVSLRPEQKTEVKVSVSDTPPVPVSLLDELKTIAAAKPQPSALDKKVDEALKRVEKIHLVVGVFSVEQILQALEGIGSTAMLQKTRQELELMKALDWLADGAVYNGPAWIQTADGVHERTGRQRAPLEPGKLLSYLASANIPADFKLKAVDEKGALQPITVQDLIAEAKERADDLGEMSHLLSALVHYEPLQHQWTKKHGDRWSLIRLAEQVLSRRNGYDTGYSRISALAMMRQRLHAAEATLDETQRKLATQIDQEITAFVDASKELQALDGSMFWPGKRGEAVRDENVRRYLTGGRLVCLVEILSKEQLKDDWIQRTVDYVARDLNEFKPEGAGTNWIFRSARALRLYREKMNDIAAVGTKQPAPAANFPIALKTTWVGINPQEIVTLRESLGSPNQQIRDQSAIEIRRRLDALRAVFMFGNEAIAKTGFEFRERNGQIEVTGIEKGSRADQQKQIVIGDVLQAVRNAKGEMEDLAGSTKKYFEIIRLRPFDTLRLKFRSQANDEIHELAFEPIAASQDTLERLISEHEGMTRDEVDRNWITWLPPGMPRAEVLAALKLADATSLGGRGGMEDFRVFDWFQITLFCDRSGSTLESARLFEPSFPIAESNRLLAAPAARFSGKWRTYFSNGQLYQQADYQNGKLHGEQQTYLKNGTLFVLKHYKSGACEGEEIEYYPSGKIRRLGQNSNDNPVGIWTYYDWNGDVKDVISFSGSPAVFAKVDGQPASAGKPVDARCELSGHVLDRKGRLVKGARIQVWRMDGVRKVDLLAGRKGPVTTDDDGHFEIHDLTDGEATVAATFSTGADSSDAFGEYQSVLLVSRYQAYCRCQLYAPVLPDTDEKYLTSGGPYKSITWSNFKFDPKSMQAAGQAPAIGRAPLAWGEIQHGLQAALVLSPDTADANARSAKLVIRNTLRDRLIAIQRHKDGENFAFEIIKPDATVEVITRDIWPLNKLPISHTSNEIYLRPGDEYELALGSLKHESFGDIQKGTSVRAHLTLFSDKEPRDKTRREELFPTTTMNTAWVAMGDGTNIDRQAPLVQLVVVDEKSGQPIPDFNVIPGTEGSLATAGDPNSLAQWQPHMLLAGKAGRAEWPQARTYEFMRLRIEADGYRPALSQLIRKAEGPLTVLIKLAADAGLDGRVISPTGQLIAFAQVGVALPARTIQIVDRRIHLPKQVPDHPADRWRLPLVVETNEQGRFHLPAEVSPAMVVAVHESGYAELRRDELTATSPTIVLQPWGRVEGQLLWGDRPGPDEKISLSTSRPTHDWIPLVSQYLTTKTDAQGRFTFEHVPRGLAQISRDMPVANPTPGNITSGHLFPIMHVNVRSSGPTPLVLGGKGQPVIGKLKGLSDWQGVTVRIFPNAPRPGDQFLWAGYGQFASSPEGKLYHRDKIPVNADGTFRIENVPAAYYQWQALGPKNEHLGGGKITIPPLPGGASDEPFDLKTVTVKPLKGGE